MELARLTIVYESTGFSVITQELTEVRSAGVSAFGEIRKAAAGLTEAVIGEFRNMQHAISMSFTGITTQSKQGLVDLSQASESEIGQKLPGHAEDAEKRIKKSFKIWSEEGINKMQGLANQAGVTFGLIGAGIVGPLTLAAKASMDFETAFTGVRKTVDASEEEFAALRSQILDMSTETPFAATAIAGIAEAAGQMGIQKKNIMGFTKTILDLGVSSNLAGEEAATMLSQFATITRMDQSQFQNLGSAIVALGNSGNSSEKDIAELSLRLSGAGKTAHMSQADILGVAAAIANVGINAEAGGTAISTVLGEIQKAAMANTEEFLRYSHVSSMTKKQEEEFAKSLGITVKELKEQAKYVTEGNEQLTNFATVAGMSASEFQKLFKADASAALDAFIQGLGRMQNANQDVYQAMSRLGIEERRQIDALLRLSGSQGELTKALGLSKQAWAENIALTDESNKFYSTSESKMKMLWNTVTELSIAVGDMLVPTLIRVVEVVKPWIESITQLIDAHPVLARNILLAAGAIGGLVLAISGVSFVLAQLAGAMSFVFGIQTLLGIGSVATGVTSIGTAATVATPAVAGLGAGLGAAALSIGFVGIAAVAVVGGLALLGKAAGATAAEFTKLRMSAESLDATTQRRIEQMRALGIVVDETAMKEMSRSERIQYLTDLELNKGDAALRAYLNSVMTKEQADLLFNQAKALRLNEEITMQEAASVALLNIDEAAKLQLIQSDAAATDAMLRQLGIRTGAAKKSVTDTAQVESELTQVVNSGVGQRMTKREQMDRAWAESFRAQLAAQEASKSAVYQQVLADREHARQTALMTQNVLTFGNQTETVFLTVMPNATEKGLSETLNQIEKFQKEIEKKAKEIRETLQGAVDMNKRHSPSINDYAKIGFQDNLSIMQGFSNQAGTILGNIRSTFREAFDFTGPLMGMASSMPPVSTPEERNQAYSDAAHSLNSIVNNNQQNQTTNYQGGNVSVHVSIPENVAAGMNKSELAFQIGQEILKQTEQSMIGKRGLAPRFA